MFITDVLNSNLSDLEFVLKPYHKCYNEIKKLSFGSEIKAIIPVGYRDRRVERHSNIYKPLGISDVYCYLR